MSGVFINYRTKDEPYFAAGIYHDLVGRFGDEQVFRDCDSLWPADHYPTVIREKLRSSEVMLVIIGPQWLVLTDDDTGERLIDRDHDWVRAEIADALSRGIAVVPVLLYDTKLPRKEDLPSNIARLLTFQKCEIHHRSYPDDVERLVKSIVALAPGVAVPQLFEKPMSPPAQWLPSTLLRPEYGVVPFAGRDTELMNLHNWAISSAPTSAQLVYAPTGSGKTRLAQQLCEDLKHEGWVAGFARENAPTMAFTGTSRITKPLLIVIDEAEFHVHQVAAAASLLTAHRSDQSRRLLLLSRHKDWLLRLYKNPDKQVADVFREMKESTLSPLAASVNSRNTEFRRAAAGFANILGQPLPDLPQPAELAEPRFGSVLTLHATALVALLDEDIAPGGADQDPMIRLRNHEYRYWARYAAGLDQGRLHIAVAAATLYGGETPEQARTLLAALPWFADASQEVIDSHLDWMRKYYPGRHTLNPIEPRRIGEDHLAAIMTIHSDLVTAPASVAAEQQISRALGTLCQTVARHPDSAHAIDDLLAIDPDRLLFVALDVLLNCDDGRPMIEAMEAHFSSAHADTLINLYKMSAAEPSAIPLLPGLTQAMTNKAAPNMYPTEGEPMYEFAQFCKNLSETLIGEFGNIFAARNITSEGEFEHQPPKSKFFEPDVIVLLKAMLSLRDRMPPSQ